MKKIIIVLSVVLLGLTIVAVTLSLSAGQKVKTPMPASVIVPVEESDSACRIDTDCVIVSKPNPGNPCCELCGEVAAISRQTETEWNQWAEENCSMVECPLFDCQIKAGTPQAKCVSNRCEIEWQ